MKYKLHDLWQTLNIWAIVAWVVIFTILSTPVLALVYIIDPFNKFGIRTKAADLFLLKLIKYTEYLKYYFCRYTECEEPDVKEEMERKFNDAIDDIKDNLG